MTGTEVTKTIVGTTTGIGAYAIVRALIKSHAVGRGPVGSILFFFGSVGIALWISDMVQDHTEKTIDDAVAQWKKTKSDTPQQ